MATALAGGMVSAGKATSESLRVHDVKPAACSALRESLPGIRIVASAAEVAECPIVFLCVKPPDVPDALAQAGEALAGSLLVSIAAGVPISRLKAHAPEGCRVIRVMPNTPALIGCGASALAADPMVPGSDRDMVMDLLGSVGLVVPVPEDLMDAVTGLSGSGPAFFYLLIEAMADAAVDLGMESQTALELAGHTARGAAEMILRSGRTPADLREMVTSPGGTTRAGLDRLEELGAPEAVRQAVLAAAARSAELGGGSNA